jgi:hypothetical protein
MYNEDECLEFKDNLNIALQCLGKTTQARRKTGVQQGKES